jgi:hypothetical protein
MSFNLGDRVVILSADIVGTVVEHSKHIDGSERFCVQFWHEGKRESVSCEARELCLKGNL